MVQYCHLVFHSFWLLLVHNSLIPPKVMLRTVDFDVRSKLNGPGRSEPRQSERSGNDRLKYPRSIDLGTTRPLWTVQVHLISKFTLGHFESNFFEIIFKAYRSFGRCEIEKWSDRLSVSISSVNRSSMGANNRYGYFCLHEIMVNTIHEFYSLKISKNCTCKTSQTSYWNAY